VDLREKLRQLRAAEGERRGLGRPLTQSEVARAMRDELGASLSQAYLSQLEGGKRVHLTHTSRETLARFYRVHPGYLVSDPADGSGLDRRAGDTSGGRGAALFPRGTHALSGFPGLHLAEGQDATHAAYAPTASAGVFPPAPERRVGGERPTLQRGWISFDQPGERAGHARRDPAGDLATRLHHHPHSRALLPLVERLLALTPPQLDAVRREVDRLQRGGEP
jgi:transcriptional regulator with XRE-family HTH domain